MLQDDVLLEIFDSYRKLVCWHDGMWNWQKLLHVCRRWRYIVLASPRRLDLHIACNRSTPTRKWLDIWPPFPISISCYPWGSEGIRGNHNIFAALQQRNRISRINLSGITPMEVEQFTAMMDEPFPALTDLCVRTPETDLHAELPYSFLGGSAPCLQSFILGGTAFPELPNLVLSASHFQYLHLHSIPDAGYIPPEAMVTFLLPLHNLKGLTIEFTAITPHPRQTSSPTLTHALLPSLTGFHFNGASQYLMDFIARIDTPMLNSFQMIFFSDLIPNISQLHTFIDRTDGLKTFIQTEVYLRPWEVQAIFKSPANPGLDITYERSDWPLSSMMRLYKRLLSIPSQVEQLELCEEAWDELDFSVEEGWHDDLYDPLWLRLLEPFVSAKSLCVSKRLGPFVTFALAELIGERVLEVLPRLENLFLEDLGSSGFVEETIKSFVSVRQLSGHPVIVRCWERKSVFGFGSSSGGSPSRSCRHLVFFSDCALRQFELQYVQCPAPCHTVWPCLHAHTRCVYLWVSVHCSVNYHS